MGDEAFVTLRHPSSLPHPSALPTGSPQLDAPTDRAGSMSEPAPVPPWPPQLPSSYLTPLKTLLSAVTMGTLQ
jgi:hypothetical protein